MDCDRRNRIAVRCRAIRLALNAHHLACQSAAVISTRYRQLSCFDCGTVCPRTVRLQTCRVCGSYNITTAYESEDIVYLACGHCQAMRAIEREPSKNPLNPIRIRPKSERGLTNGSTPTTSPASASSAQR
jgi:hypothetical protein